MARWSGVPAMCSIGGTPRAIAVSHGQGDSTPAGQTIRRWLCCSAWSSQADSPTSERNPRRVGHTWDATQPSLEATSVTAGHTPEADLSRGGLTVPYDWRMHKIQKAAGQRASANGFATRLVGMGETT